eukprot:753223-Hanusia_phi.AAC.2
MLPALHQDASHPRKDVSFLSAVRSWRRHVEHAGAGSSCLLENSRWGLTVELTADSRVFFSSHDCGWREFCEDGRVINLRARQSRKQLKLPVQFLPFSSSAESMFGWQIYMDTNNICIHRSDHPQAKLPTAILFPDAFFLFVYGDDTGFLIPRCCLKISRQQDYRHADSRETQSALQACRHLGCQQTPSSFEVVQSRAEAQRQDELGSLRRSFDNKSEQRRETSSKMQELFKFPAQLRMKVALLLELTHLQHQTEEGVVDPVTAKMKRSSLLHSNLRWTSVENRSRSFSSKHDMYSSFLDSRCQVWERLSWDSKLKFLHFLLGSWEVNLRDQQQPLPAMLETLLRSDPWHKLVLSETDDMVRADGSLAEAEESSERLQGVVILGREQLEKRRKLYLSLSGSQVSQVYDECERCGRPCNVAGSGICLRCIELLGEGRSGLGEALVTEPATYMGDSRYFRRHSGFSEYLPPPHSESPKRPQEETRAALTSRRVQFDRLFPPVVQATQRKLLRVSSMQSQGRRKIPTERLLFLRRVRNNEHGSVVEMLQKAQESKVALSKLLETRDEEGNTAFMIAAMQGSKEMCRSLMASGSHIDAQNFQGNTALHLCKMNGRTSLSAYILKKVLLLLLLLLLFLSLIPPSFSPLSPRPLCR